MQTHEETSQRTSVRLKAENLEWLRQFSHSDGRPMTFILNQLVQDFRRRQEANTDEVVPTR